MGRNKKGNTRKWRRRNVIIGTPRQDNVPSNTPSQGTLSSSTPSQKNLSNSTPSQENLSNSTPSQGNLSNSTPSQGNLSNSTPSQGNLSNSTPSQGNLSNSTPSQRNLSSNTSGQNARSHSSPEDNFKKSAPVHELSLKETVKRKYCKTFQTEEGMLIGKLSMTVDHKDEVNKVQKLSIGTPTNSPTKVILLVGATGTGKTTLINAMVNYILRVEFEDDFRFILVDDVDSDRSEAQSQTDYITAFSFHHLPGMPFEYSYVLIDTPGFGDTRGITRDRQMLTQIEMFLKQDYGIDQVDGVGFVIPASATRLTQTQRYVYEGLASIFGKNIKDNIFIMATFADARKPPVLAAIKEAKMCHGDVYKFNNSALYARNTLEGLSQSSDSDGDDDDVSMSAQYWDMAQRNMNNFFTKLGQTFPSSLTLTKEVLEERRYLQTVLTGLQQQIHLGLSKLSNLNKERDMLARLDDEMRGCMDHYVNVDVPKIEKINLKPEECVTNCMKCSFTCHYPCFLPKNVDKLNCASMKNGMCKVCPALCPSDVHFHMEFRFLITHVTEIRTVQELLNRYQNASVGKTLKEKIIQAIQDDIVNHSKLLLSMIKQVQGHVERLEEIALKPNPLSTTEYIELMIESEKMQRLPNFEQRINMLLKLKEEVSILNLAKDVSANTQLSGEALLKHFQNLMIK